MIKKTIFWIIIGLFYFTSICSAQNTAGYHGLENPLMSLGFSAANVALAEANIAQIQNPLAGFNNPACLTDTKQQSLCFLQGNLSEDSNIFSVHYTVPLYDDIVVNLNWVQMQTTQIPVVTKTDYDQNTDIVPDKITASIENGIVGALSYKVTPECALGISANLYQYRYDALSDSSTGYSISPGVVYQLSKTVSIGTYIQNLLADQTSSTGTSEKIAPTVHLGTAIQVWDRLTYFTEIEKSTTNAPISYKHSFEYKLFDCIKLRAGFYPDTNSILFPIAQTNAGVGINIGNIRLDYTYIGKSATSLSESSRINIGVLL